MNASQGQGYYALTKHFTYECLCCYLSCWYLVEEWTQGSVAWREQHKNVEIMVRNRKNIKTEQSNQMARDEEEWNMPSKGQVAQCMKREVILENASNPPPFLFTSWFSSACHSNHVSTAKELLWEANHKTNRCRKHAAAATFEKK